MNFSVSNLIDKVTEQVEKIDAKHRYYIFAAFLLAVFILDYVLLMRPQLTTLSKITPEIKITENNVKTAKNDILRLDQYKVSVEQLKKDLELVNVKVEARNNVPLILEKLSLLADQNGVKIDQIMPNTLDQKVILENNERKYFSLPILIEARSGYHGFGKFLNQVETGDVFWDVASYTIAGSTDNNLHSIKLTLNAVIYEIIGK